MTKATGKRRLKRMDCEKSPDMLAQMIVLLTKNTGSLVWDPAFGTGSTANAALSVQRRFIGSELHEQRGTAAMRRTLDRCVLRVSCVVSCVSSCIMYAV